jgi:hypothetical protein
MSLPEHSYSEPMAFRVRCPSCESFTVGSSGYPEQCGGCDSTAVEQLPMRPICDMEGCHRPQYSPEGEPGILRRCALHEIATYNTEDLTEWGEENATDMVNAARAQLMIEGGPMALVPGIDY